MMLQRMRQPTQQHLFKYLAALRWRLRPHEALAQFIHCAHAPERFEGQMRVA